jgi:hypothetical protein
MCNASSTTKCNTQSPIGPNQVLLLKMMSSPHDEIMPAVEALVLLTTDSSTQDLDLSLARTSIAVLGTQEQENQEGRTVEVDNQEGRTVEVDNQEGRTVEVDNQEGRTVEVDCGSIEDMEFDSIYISIAIALLFVQVDFSVALTGEQHSVDAVLSDGRFNGRDVSKKQFDEGGAFDPRSAYQQTPLLLWHSVVKPCPEIDISDGKTFKMCNILDSDDEVATTRGCVISEDDVVALNALSDKLESDAGITTLSPMRSCRSPSRNKNINTSKSVVGKALVRFVGLLITYFEGLVTVAGLERFILSIGGENTLVEARLYDLLPLYMQAQYRFQNQSFMRTSLLDCQRRYTKTYQLLGQFKGLFKRENAVLNDFKVVIPLSNTIQVPEFPWLKTTGVHMCYMAHGITNTTFDFQKFISKWKKEKQESDMLADMLTMEPV